MFMWIDVDPGSSKRSQGLYIASVGIHEPSKDSSPYKGSTPSRQNREHVDVVEVYQVHQEQIHFVHPVQV